MMGLMISKLFLLSQNHVKEELEKEKSKVEELNKVKTSLEGNKSKLTSELKALKEKSEKVSEIFLFIEARGNGDFVDVHTLTITQFGIHNVHRVPH